MARLLCGCCGQYFTTWGGYKPQGQDAGYGICFKCQEDIQGDEEREFSNLIQLFSGSLNDENREKFLGFSREKQEVVVMEAVNDGLIVYEVKRW